MNQQLLKELKADKTQKILKIIDKVDHLNEFDKKGKTALHLAIENQNMEVLIALLESKKPVDINILSKDEKITPLCTAINLNFLEGAEYLLKNHADANFAMDQNYTSLIYAVKGNLVGAVELLIKHHADINTVSPYHGTALHVAIQEHSVECALKLLEMENINLEEINDQGNTVLHESVKQGEGDIFTLILEKLEKKNLLHLINSINIDGNTVLHLGELYERTSFVKVLRGSSEKLGLRDNIKNKKGQLSSQIRENIIQEEKEKEEMMITKRKTDLEGQKERREKRREEVIEQLRLEEEERQRKLEEEAKVQEMEAQKQEMTVEEVVQEQNKSRFFIIVIIVLVFTVMFLVFRRAEISRKENIIY